MIKRSSSLLIVLLAMTALNSCLTPTGLQRPVGMVSYGGQGGAGSAGIHTVLTGDTVYTLSQRYHLPLRDIIALNNLAAPYHLAQGYRLKLPPPNEYRVQPGDTLNGLSRLFGVSVSETARLNNLSTPYVLNKGMTLRLPSAQPQLAQEFSPTPAPASFEMSSAPSAAPVAVPAVESETLAPPASVPQTKFLSPPQTGFPPQPHGTFSLLPARPSVVAAAHAPPSVAPNQPSIAPAVPARAASGKFMRPVDGKEISGFGPKSDGLHNDGVNIKAARGTPVRAADNGVVAYTGSEMQGYGNLVLIRHADRWMTAYAHMDKTLVKKGDVVRAGQSIGTVGSTGGVDAPQLHFEVRQGTEAMDPDRYL